MKRLTILTKHHEKLIHKYLRDKNEKEWRIGSEGYSGKIFYARISYTPGDCFTRTLTAMLEEAAARENPTYIEFPDLAEIAYDLRGTSINTEDELKLAEFLSVSASLNMEGYITFRMTDYNNKLDLIAYSFMKRLLNKNLRMTEQ